MSNAAGPPPRRIRRELRTVELMIQLYCRDHHAPSPPLCPECLELWTYAEQRTNRCRFGPDKPTCFNCPVHCFKPDKREQIRTVMRYAGPRMLTRHPILTLLHLIDGRRPAPVKPPGQSKN